MIEILRLSTSFDLIKEIEDDMAKELAGIFTGMIDKAMKVFEEAKYIHELFAKEDEMEDELE